MMPFDQNKYNSEYTKNNYDTVRFIVPKGKKEALQVIADREGKSLTALIIECLEDCLAIDLHSKPNNDV